MTGVSILVHTKNEQHDLSDCLQSVSWSDDIHVFDSGSTDETLAIAHKAGAKVTERTYGENKLPYGGDEATHRNWGLQNIVFKHPWVFVLDADERMTIELAQAIHFAVASPGSHVAFRVQRHDFFLGTWLKHVTPSPFNIRLFLREKVHYERLVNSSIIVDGAIGEIREHFDHFPFSKGMTNWVDRHNRYSSSEAAQIVHNKKENADFSYWKAFFSKNKNERRFHQKELYYRVPFRPLMMFLLLYVLKRGFLDGRAGLAYALLRSIYEYMIVLKVRELEAAAPTLDAELQRPVASGGG
jgi:glycosyltransferase involved in cell wall biosynthesis